MSNSPVQHTGQLSLHPKGFGFARINDGRSFFVSPGDAKGYVNGDRISFVEKTDRKGVSASQVKLSERNPDLIVGKIKYDVTGEMLVETEEHNSVRLVIPFGVQVAEGTFVAVKVRSATEAVVNGSIEVSLHRVLGNPGPESFDQELALARNNLASHFKPSVIAAAFKDVHDFSGPGENRVDMTKVGFVTIDGAGTKDIDDAVFLEATDDGVIAHVAIADVTHYVRPAESAPGSKGLVYLEAMARGTSVYLPGRVVPMLPESLSNGVCSLSPNVDRYAVVLTMRLDKEGQLQSHSFHRATIRSRGALTYEGVSRFLDNGDITGIPVLTSEVLQSLRLMGTLHATLQSQRDRAGRIDLDGPTVHVERDADGQWTTRTTERNTAERCIESMMLLANTTTAKHLAENLGYGVFRVQDAPSQEDWDAFKLYVKEVHGHTLSSGTPSVPEVLELLAKFEKGSEAYTCILSSFQSRVPRASYSAKPGRHFSLNTTGYAHFTSPIRRFADLTVHMLILGGLTGQTKAEGVAVMGFAAERISDLSSRSGLAEFDLTDKAKKIVYLNANWAKEDRPVEDGQVVRTTPKGLRLRLPQPQFSVFVPEASLLETGHKFNPDKERWERANGEPVVPGSQYRASMADYRENRGGYDLTFVLKP